MGGDAGPGIVVAAVARAVVRHPTVRFLLHGDEAELKPLMAKRPKLAASTEIRHSPDRVRMEEKPSQALRRGRNTSMWHAIESVAKKEADVVVSAGNTGALMAMSMVQLRVLENIDRPAIAALWPTKRGQSVVLDVGANIGTDADQLVDFAVMGEAFARAVLGLERPTVGILNVGAEDVKGNEAVRGAAQILRNVTLPIEFCGFVEGDDISEGTVDVVVTRWFHRQCGAQDGGRHGQAGHPFPAQRTDTFISRSHRGFPGDGCTARPAAQARPARVQWRHFSWPQWYRCKKPWWNGCFGFCQRTGYGDRHGAR